MSVKEQSSIFLETVIELYKKRKQRKILDEECNLLSSKLKRELIRLDRKEIFVGEYKLQLETKFEPNNKFFDMLKKNNLECFIKPTIAASDFRKILRRLNISDAELYSKYMKEQETKWLYVTKR